MAEFRYIDPHAFDDSPLVKTVKAGMNAIPSLLGRAINALGEFGEKAADSAGDVFSKVTGTSWGATHSVDNSAPQVAVAKSQEMSVPSPAQDIYSCTMNDVVCPAVPKNTMNSIGGRAQ